MGKVSKCLLYVYANEGYMHAHWISKLLGLFEVFGTLQDLEN